MKRGFSLAELLITIAVLGLLFVMASWNWRTQIGRGYDAKRKSDLARIKIAFEDYYNDKNCYPPDTILDSCGGPALQPYMRDIPCDPTKRTAYKYIPESNPCKGYRVLAALENKEDPDISLVGCNKVDGCGLGPVYNYGVSSGVTVFGEGVVVASNTSTPTPTPDVTSTPTPTPTIFVLKCLPASCGSPANYVGICGACCEGNTVVTMVDGSYLCCTSIQCP